ncbi:hypothetical protein BCAR13_60181 [Paraburkholderia caribensis]|uniref:DUF6538 domain-containing protein n=1 Tax=Paraburkholderia caribensis TaxID=75105 RepID=UPI001CB570B1|nr:hypothetical protein BCAR13_60181 [Paraburkholderia caribensis]
MESLPRHASILEKLLFESFDPGGSKCRRSHTSSCAGTVPYFRKSIPGALRSQFGRREFVCSLRTTEATEVAARADALLSKTDELLRYARRASVAGWTACPELGEIFARSLPH